MKNKGTAIRPFTYDVKVPPGLITGPDNHIKRTLSSMNGQYSDKKAYNKMLQTKDVLLYEVYEKIVPEVLGELTQGLSIVHSGKVGDEYFMTKGHFHSVLMTGEFYFCLQGHGYMMMETNDGEWTAKELLPNTALYVPGGWAHRSINVGSEDMVTLFVYPANAGHDYNTIESKGFRKIMIDFNSKPKIVDNPKWKKDFKS